VGHSSAMIVEGQFASSKGADGLIRQCSEYESHGADGEKEFSVANCNCGRIFKCHV